MLWWRDLVGAGVIVGVVIIIIIIKKTVFGCLLHVPVCVCVHVSSLYLLSCRVNTVHPSIPELKRRVLNFFWGSISSRKELWQCFECLTLDCPAHLGCLWDTPLKTREIGAEDKVEKFQLDDDFDYDNCILDLKLDKKLHRKGAAFDGSEIWWLQKAGEFNPTIF